MNSTRRVSACPHLWRLLCSARFCLGPRFGFRPDLMLRLVHESKPHASPIGKPLKGSFVSYKQHRSSGCSGHIPHLPLLHGMLKAALTAPTALLLCSTSCCCSCFSAAATVTAIATTERPLHGRIINGEATGVDQPPAEEPQDVARRPAHKNVRL